jgi:hypothetical protein
MADLFQQILPDCQPPSAKKQIAKKKGRRLQRPRWIGFCGSL